MPVHIRNQSMSPLTIAALPSQIQGVHACVFEADSRYQSSRKSSQCGLTEADAGPVGLVTDRPRNGGGAAAGFPDDGRMLSWPLSASHARRATWRLPESTTQTSLADDVTRVFAGRCGWRTGA